MRMLRLLVLLGACAGTGCFPPLAPEAPEDTALDRYETAEILYRAECWEDAVPRYEYVIKHRERWKEPYLKLSRCYEELGRRDDAVKTLKKLLLIDRHDEPAQRELARLEALK